MSSKNWLASLILCGEGFELTRNKQFTAYIILCQGNGMPGPNSNLWNLQMIMNHTVRCYRGQNKRGRAWDTCSKKVLTCHISIDVDGRPVDGPIVNVLSQVLTVGRGVDGTHPLQEVKGESLAEINSSPGFSESHLLDGIRHVCILNLKITMLLLSCEFQYYFWPLKDKIQISVSYDWAKM